MWQRIQTVYLALALIITVVCLCLPLGSYEPLAMGGTTVMYNLWNQMPDGTRDFGGVWPLFALLLVTCPLNIWAILAYNNRKLQSKLCIACILLIFLWGCYCIGLVRGQSIGFESKFHYSLTAALPIVALILYILARHGVIKDEKLVRSMDRIR